MSKSGDIFKKIAVSSHSVLNRNLGTTNLKKRSAQAGNHEENQIYLNSVFCKAKISVKSDCQIKAENYYGQLDRRIECKYFFFV